MKWSFGKGKETELSTAELNSRVRGFLLDSQINNALEISTILGCGPISEEVAEKEEEESDKRVAKIGHLMPLLFVHCQTLSSGAVEFQRSSMPDGFPELPDEVWWDSRKLLEQVSTAALLGSLSQLIDMGLLEVPKKFRK